MPAGYSTVVVQQTTFSDTLPYYFVHLHGNEITAAEAAQTFASKQGIALIRILNGNDRLVRFQLDNKQFTFDPNRIFSDMGIRETLSLLNKTDKAFAAVKQFRDTLLTLLDHSKTVIALHNNTNDRFSILHYQQTSTLRMHINADQDPDNFFLTNDATLFDKLSEANFNVVLEDADKVEEDGSLSLYCSREGVRYVNVEAEHGQLQQQTVMLNVLLQILSEKKKHFFF